MKKLIFLPALSLMLFSCSPGDDNNNGTIVAKHLVKKAEYRKMVNTDDVVLTNVLYYVDDNIVIDSLYDIDGTCTGRNITIKTPAKTITSEYDLSGNLGNEYYSYYDSQGRLTGQGGLYSLIDKYYVYNNDNTITTTYNNQDSGETGILKTNYIGSNGLIYKEVSFFPGPGTQTSTITYDGQQPLSSVGVGFSNDFAYFPTAKPESLQHNPVEINNALLIGLGQSPYYADYYYKRTFAAGGYYNATFDDDNYLIQEAYLSPNATGNPYKTKTVYFYE